MPLDFTLLTKKESQGALEVIKKFGTQTAPSDLAIILGADVQEREAPKFLCRCWTKTPFDELCVETTYYNGSIYRNNCRNRDLSIRPVLPPEETANLVPDRRKTDPSGVEVVEYGEYPQALVDKDTAQKLDEAFGTGVFGKVMALFKEKKVKPTGRTYTFDSILHQDFKDHFQPETCPEYEYKGKKYIRIKPRPTNGLKSETLPEEKKPCWVEVKPIEWLVDPTGTWVSKNALISGIQLVVWANGYTGDFQNTFMKKYLDTYFAKEIGHEERVERVEQKKREQQLAEEERGKILTGLSARLEEVTDDEAVEAIKKRLMEAEKGRKVKTAPDRLHEAARIKRLRNARDILNEAAQQAYEAGDKALLDGIIDLSSTYAARYQGQQNRVAQRRAVRRAQRKQGDRG